MKKSIKLHHLKDIGNIFSGNSINAKIKKEKYTDLEEGMPYIATKDIDYDSFINYENGISIPNSDLEAFRIATKNSVLICAEGGSAGRKIGIIDKDVCFVNKLFALAPNEKVIGKYVFYYYQTKKFQKDFHDNMTGLIGGVSKSKFQNLAIPILSLEEQQQIIEILDKAFKSIDKVKENIEKNIENTKELFQCSLNEVFLQKGKGWEKTNWGNVCDFVRGPFGGSLKKSMFKEEGYVVYEQKHAIHNHFNQLRYFIDEEKFNEMKRFELKPNDLIMSCSGVTLGRVAIVPDNIKQGIINQALLKLTPSGKLKAQFLKYWIESSIFQEIIFKHSKGAAIPNVPSAKIMKEIEFHLPLISEQEEIIKLLNALKKQTKQLEKQYQQKLENLEELKKSILQKAFSGELI